MSPGFDVNDVGFFFRADVINFHAGAGYFWNEPTESYRYLELGGAVFNNLDFDGNRTGGGIFHFASLQFLNYYWLNWQVGLYPGNVNNRLTRGGPSALWPGGVEVNINANTDNRKSWVLSLACSFGGAFDYPFSCRLIANWSSDLRQIFYLVSVHFML